MPLFLCDQPLERAPSYRMLGLAGSFPVVANGIGLHLNGCFHGFAQHRSLLPRGRRRSAAMIAKMGRWLRARQPPDEARLNKLFRPYGRCEALGLNLRPRKKAS